MKQFVLTPHAKQDVNDIWDYIADDSIEAADRVLDALDNAMVKLSKTPGIGHWREELTDKRHRFFLVYSYLIVYRHETKPQQIIRVLHRRQQNCEGQQAAAFHKDPVPHYSFKHQFIAFRMSRCIIGCPSDSGV